MRHSVLFISGRETEYIRNRVLIAALGSHFDVSILTPNARSILGRTVIGLSRFASSRPSHDVCLAGFYGQPIAIGLSALQHQPIVFDAYVSTFDTLCQDRQWFAPRSPVGLLSRWLDRRSCEVAAQVLTDTEAQSRYFAAEFAVPSSKLTALYVGCDESLFFPRDEAALASPGFEVFYYGAFLPLHGTEIIVQAAHLLRDRPKIHFTIGGHGPGYVAVRDMIESLHLTNVELVGWIPFEQLPEYIARASVCLGGHFSKVPKAARVISTKTFQFVAMQKPTVVGDNPATRELFTHGRDVYAVAMGDPEALADAIGTLAGDAELCHRIAAGGHTVFQQRLTTPRIADQLASVIVEALSSR